MKPEEKLLGKNTTYYKTYNPDVLVRVEREENRIQHNINPMLFEGYDSWHCYEASFLTDNGVPVVGLLKIVYSSSSKYIVESKSLKLYLYSLNMEKLGDTKNNASLKYIDIITKDLTSLLETEVKVVLNDSRSVIESPFSVIRYPQINLDDVKCNNYLENTDLLTVQPSGETKHDVTCYIHTDLLRSNCKVTSQPDWGDVYIEYTGPLYLEIVSFIEYIVSFRGENHFHEEVTEQTFQALYTKLKPKTLLVAVAFTRRGGIDICPIRTHNINLINHPWVCANKVLTKTLRQ